MPLSDLSNDIRLAGCGISIAGGMVRLSCGLSMAVAAFRREDAVTFWRQYASELKAAHQKHHAQHFGVTAGLTLITCETQPTLVYCNDDPANPANRV